MKPSRFRAIVAVACSVLGILAITSGLLLAYAARVLFDAEAFSRRLAASLAQPGVASFVAERLTDRLIAARTDLTGLRPILLVAARSVVSSEPFRAVVRRAAKSTHKALLSETGEKILLTAADLGVLFRSALATNPEIAQKIPEQIVATIASLDEAPGGEIVASLLRRAQQLRIRYWMLLIFGVALLALGVLLAVEKRHALLRVGVSLAIAAAILSLLVRFGGKIPTAFIHGAAISEALPGLWSGFLGGLMNWALLLGAIGLILAAASASLLERLRLAQIGSRIWQWLSAAPKRKFTHFLRAIFFLIIGALAVKWPNAMLSVLGLIAGAVLFFLGLREFFEAAFHALPRMQKDEAEVLAANRDKRLSLGAMIIVSSLALMLVGATLFFFARSVATTDMAPEIAACNGYPELCDRRLNEVVFPTTHNSMGAADISNWMFPNQEKGIPEQLRDGIRAFLIDVYYGIPIGDRVKTVLAGEETAAMKKYEATLGPEGIAAAVRIRNRLIGGDEKNRQVYLCHGLCELGALPLVPILKKVREFLIANPNEVLIVVIQDEGVAPQDVEQCFQESGLIDFVYHGTVTPPWPTLREMIASDQRVLVMAENNSASVPWYHAAFEVMQETPYTFRHPTDFSCEPNRGGDNASLFLLNHWIETTPLPLPSNAAIVNAHDFLLHRARQCQQERGMLPNLIAVDFYRTGDLFEVVKTLNGIKAPGVIAVAN
ncbi:MAG: hypothetical protein ONA90_03875 [candidate division KSB1 bacterium]|nr:hypothetical protein [candidate division KSB1 bacterium]